MSKKLKLILTGKVSALTAILALLCLFSLVLPQISMAATCTAATQNGKVRFSGGVVEFCDGTNWVSTKNAVGSTCTAGLAGKISYTSSQYQFCDGTNWYSMKNSVATTCTAAEAGKQRFNSSMLQFCDGTNWYNMASAAAPPATGIVFESSVTGSATNSTSVSSASFSTPANALIVVTAYGGATASFSSISGAGLTWTLMQNTARSSSAYAFTTTALANQIVTANFSSATTLGIVVSVYTGVDTQTSDGSNAIRIGVQTIGSSISTGSLWANTIRANSLVMITAAADTAGVTSAPAGETLNGQMNNGTISVGHVRMNATTPTVGTAVTVAADWPSSATSAEIQWIEILAPQTVVTTPTRDFVRVAENAAGNNSFIFGSINTEGVNELLLLAVTYKSNVVLTPSGPPNGWTSVARVVHASTGLTTEVFRAWASSRITNGQLNVNFASSVKATAVLVAYRGVNASGTNGSGAIDVVATGSATSANPSVNVTPLTSNSLVIGFLGNGSTVVPTAGTGFTMSNTLTNSGGGSNTSKTTAAYEVSNSLSPANVAVPVSYTATSIDWNMIAIALKPQ